MSKKIFFMIVVLLIAVVAKSEEPRPRFDPVKFQKALEQFITTEAVLSPQEAAAFFPVYREMMKKQRTIWDQMRRFHHVDADDDCASREAVEQQDARDIEIKEMQQSYHRKFMTILPAGKVYKIIKAEDKFHRQAFRRFSRK